MQRIEMYSIFTYVQFLSISYISINYSNQAALAKKLLIRFSTFNFHMDEVRTPLNPSNVHYIIVIKKYGFDTWDGAWQYIDRKSQSLLTLACISFLFKLLTKNTHHNYNKIS